VQRNGARLFADGGDTAVQPPCREQRLRDLLANLIRRAAEHCGRAGSPLSSHVSARSANHQLVEALGERDCSSG
jgi:hypothetical protein